MADEPILRRGDEGEWVRHLQRLLAMAGHYPGLVDGEFGDRTLASVWTYQRAFGLVVDGVVGADTWFQLYLPASVDTATLVAPGAGHAAEAGVGAGRWAHAA